MAELTSATETGSKSDPEEKGKKLWPWLSRSDRSDTAEKLQLEVIQKRKAAEEKPKQKDLEEKMYQSFYVSVCMA